MTTSPRIRPAATPTIGEESLVLFLLVAGAFGLGSDGKAGWTIAVSYTHLTLPTTPYV